MATFPKSLFISHGGGPLPLLGDPGHREMCECLQAIAGSIPRPDAIVVASAHWEAQLPTITAAARPSLIYDYYGFPPESYEIKYPCPGAPALAEEIYHLLDESGIEAKLDKERGFDHGLFIPLKIMYPQADIPCVQISLVNSLSPLRHIEIGHALKDLYRKNVLVLGSGFSFHNLKAFFAPDTAESVQLNVGFEDWLGEVCSGEDIPEARRLDSLCRWAEAPGARYCHPREEHLLPLHVCYGVSESACIKRFDLRVMDKQSSMFLW